MIISCDFYLFGIIRITNEGSRPQWDVYPQDMTDAQWIQYYRKTWLQPWCRYITRIKLIKRS